MRTLPARVDLSYRVFYGPLHIGNATYRFEHAANRYRISTVGEARGLAALILRGEGRVEILSGLEPTARIVAAGGAFLNDGDRVRVESPLATAPDDEGRGLSASAGQ